MDDAPFNPPLGDVAFPAAARELEPPALVAELVRCLELNGPATLHLNPGCGRRESEPATPWYPLVIALLGEASWYMRPATSRAIGVLVAGDRRFAHHFGDAPAVGRLFAKAADQAEALAAGKTSFQPSKELN